MSDSLKNPFFNIYHWLKGEIFDIEAVNNALATRDWLNDKVGKNEKKKKSTQENLDNVKQGKTTVKTLFKQNDVGLMTVKIENVSQIFVSYHLYRPKKKLR